MARQLCFIVENFRVSGYGICPCVNCVRVPKRKALARAVRACAHAGNLWAGLTLRCHTYRCGAKMVSRLSLLLRCKPGPSAALAIAWRTCSRLGCLSTGHTRRTTAPFDRTLTVSSFVRSSEHKESANRRPKAVIFDVGGVVVPSPLPVFARFEERHGLRHGSVIETIKRTGASGAFAKLERGEYTVEQFSEPFSKEFLSLFGMETEPEIFGELIEDIHNEDEFRPHSVVLDVIAQLKERGVKTAILTNNFRFDDGRTQIGRAHV